MAAGEMQKWQDCQAEVDASLEGADAPGAVEEEPVNVNALVCRGARAASGRAREGEEGGNGEPRTGTLSDVVALLLAHL